MERGAVAGREIDRVEDVLHADRQAAQRPGRDRGILRALSRRVEIERNEGADFRFARDDRAWLPADLAGWHGRAALMKGCVQG